MSESNNNAAAPQQQHAQQQHAQQQQQQQQQQQPHHHRPPAASRSIVKALTTRLMASILDDEGSGKEIQKHVMDKLVAPSIRLLYTQLMPYLWILVGLMLVQLVLIVLTFCLSAFQFARVRGFGSSAWSCRGK